MYTSSTVDISNQVSGFSKSLSITNQYKELVQVALWLEQASQNYQFPESVVFKLDLVLNEVLGNIISYAYTDELSHDILIKLEDGEDNVVLEIMDDGKEFNPFTLATPSEEHITLESATINGRGILLVKAFTDKQDYHRKNNANIMRVTIQKSPEKPLQSAANIGD
jgi:sigma-B regulation protein RsbU (phosphoserine phosphatase)